MMQLLSTFLVTLSVTEKSNTDDVSFPQASISKNNSVSLNQLKGLLPWQQAKNNRSVPRALPVYDNKKILNIVHAELSTCRHGRPQVTCRLLYKSVLLLVFGFILWKWMNGVDSLGSNQKCRIGYKHFHSRVSQCLASIRKLGYRRSSEGLRSFKPSKGTSLFILIILAGDIEINPGPRFQRG